MLLLSNKNTISKKTITQRTDAICQRKGRKMNNIDLYEYADHENIAVEHIDLPKNKALSVMIGQSEYIGIDKAVADGSAEERTLLAHELGHCATGAFYDIGAASITRARCEHRAVKWALLKCVPKQKLVTLLKCRYRDDEIADYFGVSEKMIHIAYTYYFEYGIAC